MCCVTRADSCWPTDSELKFQCSVASCGGRRGTEPRSSLLLPLPLLRVLSVFLVLIIIHPLFRIHLSPCDGPDKAAHHHILGLYVGVFVSDSTLRKLSFCFVAMLKFRILRCTSCAQSSRNQVHGLLYPIITGFFFVVTSFTYLSSFSRKLFLQLL